MNPLDPGLLPPGVRARCLDGVNGLRVHLLEAGDNRQPLVLLLHGFPELAYSWRKVIAPLADAGFHVVAPDVRGYGRTTGWDAAYDTDLTPFGPLNLLRDALCLVAALGHRRAAMVVGHDAGSSIASACALVRPDVFRSVALMSAPFAGPPALPGNAPSVEIEHALARLDPPRKHYHWYFSSREADADMRRAGQGLHRFLRAYYHCKSADWPGNAPHPLQAWSAAELAKLPTYYVMRLRETMAQTVAHLMPSEPAAWLPDAELAVYAAEFVRVGFQGGLDWYRARTTGLSAREMATFAGRAIDVPACFIAGAADWGVRQKAGDFEAMQDHACARLLGCHLVERAGHWVQQEQPGEVARLLLDFLAASGAL